MMQFLFSDLNTAYSIALGIVISLAILEGVGMLIGLSVMNMLDQISPIDINVDFNVESTLTTGGLTPLLGWLCLNRLPLLVWLILFLTCFGMTGLSINFMLINTFSIIVPAWLSYSVSFIFACFLTRLIGKPLARLLPKNESSAISKDSFKGLIATITIGKAKIDSPSEASVIDRFSQKHYLMVAPENNHEEFTQGDQVVLVEKLDKYWLAIKFIQ